MAEISAIISVPKCAQNYSGWNNIFSNSWNNCQYFPKRMKSSHESIWAWSRERYSFGSNFCVHKQWQAYFHLSIYCWNFDFMAKPFDESPRSNSTLESIAGSYITLWHMFTLSRPPRLNLIFFDNVEIQEIGRDNVDRSVAGRKFYDLKIIFFKNIAHGASNAPKGVFWKHFLARVERLKHLHIWTQRGAKSSACL